MEKYYIGKESVVYKFDKEDSPVLRCDLPARLVVDMKDTFTGHVSSEAITLDMIAPSVVNPSSGPVYFNGIQPGDVLEIKINKIDCKSPGFVMCAPNEGCIGDLVKKAVTKIYPFKDNVLEMSQTLKIKMEPMIGVIGIAPAGEPAKTGIPGDHGGNMDCRLIKEGATLFLPVQVEGGLLALGDLHASQGDGESFATGLEVEGQAEIEVDVRRDLKMTIPFVASDGKFASVATADSTDKALHDAMAYLVDFIVKNGDLNFYDAGFLCGLFADLEISQIVDNPMKTARMSVKLDILKKTGVKLFI